MKVEDGVGVDVLAGDSLGPEFLHEEDLVGELRGHGSQSITSRRRATTSLADPVGQMTNKVEEEITVWHTDHCNSHTVM